MSHTHSLQLKNIKDASEFMLGGNATFTVVSSETGKRYTFRTRKADFRKAKKDQDQNTPLFVQYLNGSDNTSSYTFLGTIFGKDTYRFSKKSKTGFNSVVNKTFMFIFDTILNGKTKNFDKIEFWHEGRCGKCNRPLTDPVSILRGFGPVCVPASTWNVPSIKNWILLTGDERKIKEREAKLAGLFELFATV